MLNLSKKLTLNKAAIESDNLLVHFSAEDRQALGAWALDGYKRDRQSRAQWERRMVKAMRLAMQITKAKTFPWPDCSNVAFPLISIAAIQFHSRAYPAMIPGPELVRYNSTNSQRNDRVGTYMSYQLLEESRTWEETHDKLIYNVAIVGCAFKKSYHDLGLRQNVSDLVMAKDLVLDYYATSVEGCQRKTHCIPMTRNDVHERIMRGIYIDIREDSWYTDPQIPQEVYPSEEANADFSGQEPPASVDETTPFSMLEQHCLIDLDNDGYAEPYILTLDEVSGTPVRLVTRFDREHDIERNARGEIIKIYAEEYFTKYGLLPAPDGAIYDIGFGILLGPLNDSVSTIINQLVDSGTMATTAGGFLGRGAKIRGGTYSFSPFEWKRIDSTIDDVSKAIFPLPVREPSPVLFKLLGLIIEYTQRVAGATDTLSGDNPGQNTPAETSRSMVNEGMKIYNAIYKRLWRSMKEEFRKLYILNGKNLQGAIRAEFLGDPNLVGPGASPYILSEEQEFKQAVAIKQAAQTTPGYNRDMAERRYLKALRVPDIDTIFPGEDKAKPLPNPKMQIEQSKLQLAMKRLDFEQKQMVGNLMEEHELNKAKIAELSAKSMKEVAQAQGVRTGHEIAMFEAQLGLLKVRNDSINDFLTHLLKGIEHDSKQQAAGQGNNGGGVQDVAQPSSNGAPSAVPPNQDSGSQG